MLNVVTSDRVLSRNTGGNTTYARNIFSRLNPSHFRHVALAPPELLTKVARRGTAYALWEGIALPAGIQVGPHDQLLVHATADTGPLRRTRDVPIVATVHGIASLHIGGVRSRQQEALWRARVGQLVKVADTVITVSQSSARDIESLWPKAADKLTVIHHGVDHSRFHVNISGASLGRLPIPDRYILYLGNLDPRKNIRGLMQAIRLLRREGVDIPLVVAGAPAWRDSEVVEELRATEGVLYIGSVADDLVAPLISAAEAFLFPSLYEGFGLPVLEAMACGTPVVTSARGSLPEVTGDAALICEPDPASIARAVHEVLTDHAVAADLRHSGPKQAAKFRWDVAVSRHEETYKRNALV
jgi:glycosyltransferase involved in cell wall biosynthesis